MKKRILFVDDMSNVLQGLRRMLRSMRHEWDMVFVESGNEALARLAQESFDVIVSDMRMPGMDGVQLLTQVMERYPHLVRIILSGHADNEMILKSVGPAHQYLSKPCDAETIKETITRACALRDLLADATLQQLVSGMQTLPSLPTLYLEVLEAVQAPDGSLEQVGQIVERDAGMTAKVLQLVNSAFFGLRRHISSPAQAVGFLGLDTFKALALSVHIFTHFEQSQVRDFSLNTLWRHGMAAGACAKRIAKAENCDQKMVDEAFMAGLLHDAGKLVLAANLPAQYSQALAQAQAEGVADWQAEQATFGATHAEVGAYLLGLWGLPDPIIEALAFHHCPSTCPAQRFGPLTAVHVANAVVYELDTADVEEHPALIDHDYLARLGLHDRLAIWQQHCQTALQEESHA